jgi:hypothetical protein
VNYSLFLLASSLFSGQLSPVPPASAPLPPAPPTVITAPSPSLDTAAPTVGTTTSPVTAPAPKTTTTTIGAPPTSSGTINYKDYVLPKSETPAPQPRAGFFARLRSVFNPQRPTAEAKTNASLPLGKSETMPVVISGRATTVANPTATTLQSKNDSTNAVTTLRPSFDSSTKPGTMPAVTTLQPSAGVSATDVDKVGHDQNYAWITGRITRTSRNGAWVIHYTAPNEVDRFNGNLVLSNHPELAHCQDGDLICVHGQVRNNGRNGATYNVTEVHVMERGGRALMK